MSESATRVLVCSSVALALVGTLLLTVSAGDPAGAARSEAGALSGPARVLDGDTLDIEGRRVRLEGIDAPELGQSCRRRDQGAWPCGIAAAKALESMIGNRDIDCSPAGVDKYGRTLGLCRSGALDLNREMVRVGLAWAFVKYSTSYVAVEAEARRAGTGVWQADNDPAWVFRERQWAGAEVEAPEGCAIKGNISDKGHIYHMPWSPWYKRVKVDPIRGERWFCSEADAEAAGWRPAMAH